MTLFHELKRRNVFKVAASYTIVAWIVLQVADTTFSRLNIPDWVISLLIILFLLGFPLAIFLAWAYEMTPDGLKPTAEVPVESSIRAQTGHKMNLLTLGGVAVLLVLVLLDAFLLEDAPAAGTVATATPAEPAEAVPDASADPLQSIPEQSIAVLPFENLSDDTEQEYFSDGLSEELINKLSQVPDLLVTGRNSSFYFKDRTEELREIGSQLGVSHILQGSVRRAGDTVRISAQLMDAQQGFNLWSRTYDRPMADIFAVQDEIAQEVTTALSITLGAGRFALPGYTRNVEAWDLLLKVREAGYQYTPDSIMVAVEAAERAVELDPEFGLAWQALLSASNAARVYHPDQQDALRQRATEAADAVRRLLPGHPAERMNAALVEALTGELQQAETLMVDLLADVGNSNATANSQYAQFLMAVGRLEAAMPYLRKAQRLDPLDPVIAVVLAGNLTLLQRYEESEAEFQHAVSLDQLSAPLHAAKAFLEIEQGRYADARASTDKLIASRAGQLELLDHLEAGTFAEGLAAIRRLQENPTQTFPRHTMAFAALFGDPQLALEIHRQPNVVGRLGPFAMDVWRAIYADMRALPEFKTRVEELGFVDYWRSTGNWADKCRPVNDDYECF